MYVDCLHRDDDDCVLAVNLRSSLFPTHAIRMPPRNPAPEETLYHNQLRRVPRARERETREEKVRGRGERSEGTPAAAAEGILEANGRSFIGSESTKYEDA
jgi:hypothetical protein